jgi:hypothetical protein
MWNPESFVFVSIPSNGSLLWERWKLQWYCMRKLKHMVEQALILGFQGSLFYYQIGLHKARWLDYCTPSHGHITLLRCHFTHEPRAVTMKLREPKGKCPKAIPRHLPPRSCKCGHGPSNVGWSHMWSDPQPNLISMNLYWCGSYMNGEIG